MGWQSVHISDGAAELSTNVVHTAVHGDDFLPVILCTNRCTACGQKSSPPIRLKARQSRSRVFLSAAATPRRETGPGWVSRSDVPERRFEGLGPPRRLTWADGDREVTGSRCEVLLVAGRGVRPEAGRGKAPAARRRVRPEAGRRTVSAAGRGFAPRHAAGTPHGTSVRRRRPGEHRKQPADAVPPQGNARSTVRTLGGGGARVAVERRSRRSGQPGRSRRRGHGEAPRTDTPRGLRRARQARLRVTSHSGDRSPYDRRDTPADPIGTRS